MKQFLKENWFVVVVAVFFISVACYVGYDQNKDNLPSKNVGGKDIVFSIDDNNVTADDLYDHMNKSFGQSKLFLEFKDAVVNSQIEETAAIKNEINYSVQQTIAYYTQTYGYGEEYLDYLARYQYGYNTFKDYVSSSIKLEHLLLNYINEHHETYVTDEFVKENSPRIIRYCVIKFDKPDTPTQEEKDKLKEAQDAWASDEYNVDNFADFATKYSQDSGAANGGLFGYVDKNTSVTNAFKAAATALKDGEVSEWIFDENYGYFLIKCDSTKYEDYKNESGFMSSVIAKHENMPNQVIWECAQKAGVKFANPEDEEYIKSILVTSESEGE